MQATFPILKETTTKTENGVYLLRKTAFSNEETFLDPIIKEGKTLSTYSIVLPSNMFIFFILSIKRISVR